MRKKKRLTIAGHKASQVADSMVKADFCRTPDSTTILFMCIRVTGRERFMRFF